LEYTLTDCLIVQEHFILDGKTFVV